MSYKKRHEKYYQIHKGECRERNKRWLGNHPGYMREALRKYRAKLRLEVLGHYSSELKCVKCGFVDIRALSIDHINGGGNRHMRKLKLECRGVNFYAWLKRNGFPEGYQVLCMNCQFIKRHENNECS